MRRLGTGVGDAGELGDKGVGDDGRDSEIDSEGMVAISMVDEGQSELSASGVTVDEREEDVVYKMNLALSYARLFTTYGQF